MSHFRTETTVTVLPEAGRIDILQPRPDSLFYMLSSGGLIVRSRGIYILSANVRSTSRVRLWAEAESIDSHPIQSTTMKLVDGDGLTFGSSCLLLGDASQIQHPEALLTLWAAADREASLEVEFWINKLGG